MNTEHKIMNVEIVSLSEVENMFMLTQRFKLAMSRLRSTGQKTIKLQTNLSSTLQSHRLQLEYAPSNRCNRFQ